MTAVISTPESSRATACLRNSSLALDCSDESAAVRVCVVTGGRSMTSPLANLMAGCMAAWMVAGASAEGFLM